MNVHVIWPHCDARILHAPGECMHCDKHPDWQCLRAVWGIAFSGKTPKGGEVQCPADRTRGGTYENWGGNRPVKSRTDQLNEAVRQLRELMRL